MRGCLNWQSRKASCDSRMRRRSTEKGTDMNLKKCACVGINDREEIRRYFERKKGKKVSKTRGKLVCCDTTR